MAEPPSPRTLTLCKPAGYTSVEIGRENQHLLWIVSEEDLLSLHGHVHR